MTKEWLKFYVVRLPASAILLAIVVQIVASLLSQVPMRRNRSDDLAIAVESGHEAHRVLLLGDSVIRDSTSRYMLGRQAGDVANLSTHGALGVPGEYFLLKRYLGSHPAPRYVVLAMSPEVYFGFAKVEKMHYYMWYTFSRPEEREFLLRYLPGINQKDRYPAILDVQERVVERLFGLLKSSVSKLSPSQKEPRSIVSVEPPANSLMTRESAQARVDGDERGKLRPLEMASLAGICQLSLKYKFEIRLVWPPTPKLVSDGLVSTGVYKKLIRDISEAFSDSRCTSQAYDLDSSREYLSFRKDSMHILGDGWEERVAGDLRNYITSLRN